MRKTIDLKATNFKEYVVDSSIEDRLEQIDKELNLYEEEKAYEKITEELKSSLLEDETLTHSAMFTGLIPMNDNATLFQTRVYFTEKNLIILGTSFRKRPALIAKFLYADLETFLVEDLGKDQYNLKIKAKNGTELFLETNSINKVEEIKKAMIKYNGTFKVNSEFQFYMRHRPILLIFYPLIKLFSTFRKKAV